MTGGLVLGAMGNSVYKSKRITLQAGDGLLLYTDGITEAMDGSENEYGEERLQGCLKRYSNSALTDIIQGVIGEVKSFSVGAPQTDDITVLALRYLSQ
jgi:sigma-B regulation protein RsbU (phosphoserine phosphatase)